MRLNVGKLARNASSMMEVNSVETTTDTSHVQIYLAYMCYSSFILLFYYMSCCCVNLTSHVFISFSMCVRHYVTTAVYFNRNQNMKVESHICR